MVALSGKSAREVSQEIGRSPSFISTTISKRSDVRVGTIAEIAKATGCELVVKRGEDEIHLG
ncbi:MAG: hypothetical protein SOV20_08755 [Coriobacteriales bacterium]|nr:hypothetical protein [Coriobacteriales bacterium]